MSLRCPKCGKEVFEEAAFCQYCGANMKGTQVRTSVYPTVAGALEINATGICLFLVVVSVVDLLHVGGFGVVEAQALLFIGIFGLAGFTWGLISAIFTLKRKHFDISIGGMFLLIFSGFITIVAFSVMFTPSEYVAGLIFGIPLILLAALSLVFAAISEREFPP